MGCWALIAILILLLAAIALVWSRRERIAESFITDALAENGIEATYQIAQIGTGRQILTDIVIGDPASPDLTIDRAEVLIKLRFGLPDISEVRLVRPRLFATYHDGELSLGALDPLVFGEDSGEPFRLPGIDLIVEDGRGLLETDFGSVGMTLQGQGSLRGGFSGEFAATTLGLIFAGCEALDATLGGRIVIENERPSFSGPLHFGQLGCDGVFTAPPGSVDLALEATPALDALEGRLVLDVPSLGTQPAQLSELGGTVEFNLNAEGLTARYALNAGNIVTEQARLSRIALEGGLRARQSYRRIEIEGSLEGQDLGPGEGYDRALAQLADAAQGTLLAPLTAKLRRQLEAEGRGSALALDFSARRTGGELSLVIPDARIRGGSGSTLLRLSRLRVAQDGESGPVAFGNFATGGEGLPRLAGSLDRAAGGNVQLRLAMAPYTAGDARLALPEFELRRDASGTMRFSGRLQASGAIPGGEARGLAVPLLGSWRPGGALQMWRRCTDVRYDNLQVANLSLDGRSLRLCPPEGSAILEYGPAGLRLAAGVPSLDLSGRLGETPVRLRSGAVGFAWPGVVTGEDLQVSLGPEATATRFAIADLTARTDGEIGGEFSGTDVTLFQVPLDVLDAHGEWAYVDDRLILSGGRFRLEDRQEQDRFHPLSARGASLTLYDNRITAEATLYEPMSGAEVVDVALRHNLLTSAGQADLAVQGLTFGENLQPMQLTELARGVVANVEGTVTGSGRVAWDAEEVTSTGRFSSESLDLAAAFGPVKGASGTVEFTDLLGLTTAPNQEIAIAAVNPGIEVFDGVARFQLREGEFLDVQGGVWPFLGGTLTMRPVTLQIGAREARSYFFEIEGLQASQFVQRVQLDNLSATGVFDGTVPVIFDEDGNGRLQDGLLISRPPGGNVSYVGELTYEDLSPMANFAFDTLRSLDYRQMRIAMDGSLTGQIVTRVRFDGVTQGEGAEKNFITRRLNRLPIRFILNVRAPFYSLISSIRSLYDPSEVRDPRDLGLLEDDGTRFRPRAPEPERSGEPTIQPPESENQP